MNKKIYLAIVPFLFVMASCVKDLSVMPIDPNLTTANNVYRTAAGYKDGLARLYATLALGGGLSNLDDGTSPYIRSRFTLQELSTDAAAVCWADATLPAINYQTWDPQNSFVNIMYTRLYFNISLCNEYLRQNTDAVMASRGITNKDSVAAVQAYRYEARFLRALYYRDILDMFGTGPFADESNLPGSDNPKQIGADSLFAYVERELLSIASSLPTTNEYGRANQAAAYTLLAQLYLNAKVYVGTDHNADCITYCNKVISSGLYSLDPNYKNLFLADNNLRTDEIIFPIAFDGVNTQSFGGTTYLIAAATTGDADVMNVNAYGLPNSAWAGVRRRPIATKALYPIDIATQAGDVTIDNRAYPLITKGVVDTITDITQFKQGYPFVKFQNVTSTGANGKNSNFADTDFPLFRYADVLLMYTEAVVRGGAGGDIGVALGYIQQIQQRAGVTAASGYLVNATGDLTLEFILDERARELSWEGYRRTDLRRFGKFTGGAYIWDWKGAVANGVATDKKYELFPLPFTDLTANPNLKQLPGTY